MFISFYIFFNSYEQYIQGYYLRTFLEQDPYVNVIECLDRGSKGRDSSSCLSSSNLRQYQCPQPRRCFTANVTGMNQQVWLILMITIVPQNRQVTPLGLSLSIGGLPMRRVVPLLDPSSVSHLVRYFKPVGVLFHLFLTLSSMTVM